MPHDCPILRPVRPLLVALVVLILAPAACAAPAAGASAPAYHTAQVQHTADTPDATVGGEAQVIPFMMAIVVILMAAKGGGEVFERFGQSAVLGELLIGVILGNIALTGYHGLDLLKTNEGVSIASQIGAILLLFEVGLESRLKDFLAVGLSSFLVAVAGVIAPMLLGWGVGVWLLPGEPFLLHLFLGATLAATSVGITARVLQDLKKVQTREARIILGAAVIDDVLGLIVLAVVGGLIHTAAAGNGMGIPISSVVIIVVKAALFLAGAVVAGALGAGPLLRALSHMCVRGVLTAAGISICFTLAALAGLLGLAPIVGAFAAGLVLEPSHYQHFTKRGERSLEELISPMSELFVPVFFVLMGLRVDLRSFLDSRALGLAAALIVAAVAGKMVCGPAALGKGLNRLVISVGMIPRGEVGLIFASIGATMVLAGERVVDPMTYSAVIVMVMVTTFLTPIWLKAIFAKTDKTTNGHELAIEGNK